jgi:hypothetical protein
MQRWKWRPFAAVLAAGAVVLSLGASASATPTSRGALVVLLRLDSGCGGPRICIPELLPYAGAHLEIRAVGRPVKLTVVSDRTGRVSLGLRVGLWRVVPQSADALAPRPVQVRVAAGRTTQIRLVYLRPKM